MSEDIKQFNEEDIVEVEESQEETPTLYDFGEEYEPYHINELLDDAASLYAAEVNLNRAIPDVRDGLKPVQRKSLYAMSDLGLDPKKPHVKSARIAGEIIGKYHAHGDGSAYGAFVLLAQPHSMNEILVDGHGNFGSINGARNAAMRYTEARLSEAGYQLVKDIKRNAVDMIPNFDGSELEPRVLPAPYPQALLNGQMGIGWSTATSIAPHNINELLDLSIYCAKTPKENVDIEKVKEIFKGPDFMTGCDVIMTEEDYIGELTKGRAKFIQRAVLEYVVTKKESYIRITNIPYKVTTDKLNHQMLVELTKTKAFGFEDLEDLSKGTNLDIRLIFKKGTDETKLRQVAEHLYKKTQLQESITVNNLMIHKGKPTNFGVLRYIRTFNEFRLETLKRIWDYENSILLKRLHIIEGLLRLKDITDEVIKIARNSSGKSDFKDAIVKQYQFTEEQAEHIASIQIYQLGRQNFEALQNEFDEKTDMSNKYQLWLTDEKEATKQLVKDLQETKKAFKHSVRKSNIIDANSLKPVKQLKVEEMIDDRKVKVVIKRDLEMFQIGAQAFDNQIDAYAEDDIVAVLDTRTVEYVTAITSDGHSVTRFVNDLPRTDLSSRTDKLNTQVNDLKSDSVFVGGYSTDGGDANRIIALTKNGYLKTMVPSKIMPNTKTKAYFKKIKTIFKTKEADDEIVAVFTQPVKKFENLELHVIANDPSKKSGSTIRKVALGKYAERDNGAGGSGSRAINLTTKGQKITYRSSEIVDVTPKPEKKPEVVETEE